MMNRIQFISAFLSAILFLGTGSVNAQNNPEYRTTFQVSFFLPLSTNGSHAGEYTNDFSFNILAGISKNEEAFAFAGLANVIRREAEGFQFAGLTNYTGHRSEGFQFAGLTNIVGGPAEGLQFAGLGNVSREFSGFQFAGLGNVADDVEGGQFGGLFNKARNVSGVQFAGLLNIADRSDYPIGLINLIRNGEMGLAVGYNEIGTTSITFRSGGRVMYGILGLGYNHEAPSKKAASIVAGYGAHIDVLPWLRINNEITTENFGVFSEDSGDSFKAGYALLPAFRPVRQIEIFGGPSINYMQTKDSALYRMFPGESLWRELSTSGRSRGRLQSLFIGWQAGVQFIF